ncbi:serine--tRNA ligase [Candidatus Roizmanbacteria bacterium CG_4_10_14_0_2_um_filter_36_35]|uniref:Serine--tRNA ligase n=4 Tax=Candidatus Roizmaniibacteriota TaxID=1752723 RepID=A0A2M7BWQ1_9BACT|nr:MAG: serine--tRNA ligase [Candidatus Roizmanbacteria bacterium CG11_big_fil_rev_8_21_14_0_20_35_14]PIV11002.1 MAG: serine--tRNA ligase [Candidatus Roizmanbacteria bacterium CG03_land_8_20_14_0_80_35_26]PIZ67679.1 MAG: serine--tRNA ligase [Candidatus Roizmanbacteria bacterium CG_4_10_14_0_2_um_filter_36_35]PJC33531.1 MAG: serine--tRNA ligase [Candidatus Roizmanbacteria bacterium CG_4_9_14_0_2_um_filter_36_12]
MLSLDFIRTNKAKILEAAKNKGRQVDLDKIISLDDERRKLIQQTQKLREERNKLAKQGKPHSAEGSVRGREIKDELKKIEEKLAKIQSQLDLLISYVPNVPLDEVPIGKDATGNKELRKWGDLPKFDFKPKSHIELGEDLDLIDLERGAKVSGFRGYFLKNQAALLQSALMFYVFNKLVKKDYTPIIAPAVIKGFALFGCGQFPWGEQDTYKLNDEDAYLAGTAEQPVTSYYSGEILNEKDLPKKFVAFSPCFRKEAGAYGKDTKGLYRLHEFWKVEQVIIGKNDIEEAKELHEELQKNCEEILQDLKLPYRVLLMCTGDMGEPQMKKYDTETWMPSRQAYGETMSNSIMGDFQTRRLKIKYRKKDGSTEYCFSLNNTALASPRILIAILENYQQKDGSITIPKILQPLVGFEKINTL